jgi:hypothetical protein
MRALYKLRAGHALPPDSEQNTRRRFSPVTPWTW